MKMTITNNKVILHLPKTAGSSVRWNAMKVDGFQYSCQHCHYKMLPEEFKDMPKVSFIRFPMDWYVSYYEYTKKNSHEKERLGLLFTDVISEDFTKSFQETLPLLINLTKCFKERPDLLMKFKNNLKQKVTNDYKCWIVSYFDNISTITPETFENKSMYQWLYDIVGLDNATVYRVEDQFEEGMRKEFPRAPIQHRNVNKKRKPFREYYTKELEDMVTKADSYILDKYYKDFQG